MLLFLCKTLKMGRIDCIITSNWCKLSLGDKNMYDILIVGGGPAGLMAGIYAKRSGKSVAIIERFASGGQLNLIGEIENYLGFERIDGPSLAMKFTKHAKSLEIPFIQDEITSYHLDGRVKRLEGRRGQYEACAVILALGCHARELQIEGERKFKGQGVSYCAVCDGNFFKNRRVAVVGSGDSAFSDALYLSSLCKHVYVLTKDKLNLHNYAENELEKYENITLFKGAMSKKIMGDASLEGIMFERGGKEETLDVDGVFVAIGRSPDTLALKGLIDMTDRGYIFADKNMKTSLEGVYVCGDVREGSIAQISTAVGDGAVAGTEASKYITRLGLHS